MRQKKQSFLFPSPNAYFRLSQYVPLLLRLLIAVTLLGLFGGIIKTLLGLEHLVSTPVEKVMHELLLNVITLLAVVEVVKTALSYLTDGRVHVTFIVDTVLIVMLNEIISLWFKGPTLMPVILLVVIILTLIIVRILAIRFSPDINSGKKEN